MDAGRGDAGIEPAPAPVAGDHGPAAPRGQEVHVQLQQELAMEPATQPEASHSLRLSIHEPLFLDVDDADTSRDLVRGLLNLN